MSYLLDTCVLSELRRPQPDAGLLDWLSRVSESRLFLAVTALGEIQQGIAQLHDRQRQQALQLWLDEDLTKRFHGRILDIDRPTMLRWGVLQGEGRRAGRPPSVIDSLIAAAGIRHDLTLVTRNVSDFENLPVRLLNPWTEIE